jgi:hypothetical protein
MHKKKGISCAITGNTLLYKRFLFPNLYALVTCNDQQEHAENPIKE